MSNRSGTVKPFRNGHERDTVPEQFSRRNGPGCTQKGENKRTVPQRAKPFRKAQICFLTEVKLYVCSGTDYQTAAVKIVRSGTVYCSGTVYTVLTCAEQGANPHSHSRQETDRRKIRRAGRQSDQSDEKEGGSHGGVPTHSSRCSGSGPSHCDWHTQIPSLRLSHPARVSPPPYQVFATAREGHARAHLCICGVCQCLLAHWQAQAGSLCVCASVHIMCLCVPQCVYAGSVCMLTRMDGCRCITCAVSKMS